MLLCYIFLVFKTILYTCMFLCCRTDNRQTPIYGHNECKDSSQCEDKLLGIGLRFSLIYNWCAARCSAVVKALSKAFLTRLKWTTTTLGVHRYRIITGRMFCENGYLDRGRDRIEIDAFAKIAKKKGIAVLRLANYEERTLALFSERSPTLFTRSNT